MVMENINYDEEKEEEREDTYEDLITMMRLAGGIETDDPKAVTAIVLGILYKNSLHHTY